MEQSLFGYYLLPEDAQLQLLQARDHLRLLATLVRPHSAATSDLDELKLRASDLAFCFELVAKQLDAILEQTELPVM
ncbi:XAC0095 family protein [Xanthomonas cannabis]|uniref:XAC0095 family protein n=1 Tax=Xanthomonas cannabis TaxID=1885674 RepID=UPI00141B3A4E|nr:hypothetical protein [Xanthomonas cannabis]NIK02808.1 hypothetical protein [Xanthomonas cannabis]NIK65005.1 hypothetical protein [Xanthomonas cannabis]